MAFMFLRIHCHNFLEVRSEVTSLWCLCMSHTHHRGALFTSIIAYIVNDTIAVHSSKYATSIPTSQEQLTLEEYKLMFKW